MLLCAKLGRRSTYVDSRVTVTSGDEMSSITAGFVRAIGLTAGFLAPAVVAQFPPTPEGVTVLESKFGGGVTISYKEVGMQVFSSVRYLVASLANSEE